jgi:hypothetical protein
MADPKNPDFDISIEFDEITKIIKNYYKEDGYPKFGKGIADSFLDLTRVQAFHMLDALGMHSPRTPAQQRLFEILNQLWWWQEGMLESPPPTEE